MKKLLFVLMFAVMVSFLAVDAQAAMQLTEYTTDDTGVWKIYAPVVTGAPLGEVFATKETTFLEKVRFWFANTYEPTGGDTAGPISSRNICLTLYQDTTAEVILAQDTFQISMDTQAQGWKYFNFYYPLNKNRYYYLEISSDSADTACRIQLSDAVASSTTGYVRGNGTYNRGHIKYFGYAATNIFFGLYTNWVTEVSMENWPDSPIFAHILDINTGTLRFIDYISNILNVEDIDSGSLRLIDRLLHLENVDTGTLRYIDYISEILNVQDVDSGALRLIDRILHLENVDTGTLSLIDRILHVENIDTGTLRLLDRLTAVGDIETGTLSLVDEILNIVDIDSGALRLLDRLTSIGTIDSGTLRFIDYISNITNIDSGTLLRLDRLSRMDSGLVDAYILNSIALSDTQIWFDTGTLWYLNSLGRIDTGTLSLIDLISKITDIESGALRLIDVVSKITNIDSGALRLIDLISSITKVDSGFFEVTRVNTGIINVIVTGQGGDPVIVSEAGEFYITPAPSRGDSIGVYITNALLTAILSDTNFWIKGIDTGTIQAYILNTITANLGDTWFKCETGTIDAYIKNVITATLSNTDIQATIMNAIEANLADTQLTRWLALMGDSLAVYVMNSLSMSLPDTQMKTWIAQMGDSIAAYIVNDIDIESGAVDIVGPLPAGSNNLGKIIPFDGTTTPMNDPKLSFSVTETIWEKNILGASAYTGDSYMYLAGSGVETWCLMVGADTVFAEINISSVATTTYQMYEVGNTVSFGTAIAAPRNLNRSSTNTSTVVFYSGTTSSDLGTQLAYSAGTRGTMTIELKPNQAYIWIIRNGIGGSESVYCNIRYFHY